MRSDFSSDFTRNVVGRRHWRGIRNSRRWSMKNRVGSKTLVVDPMIIVVEATSLISFESSTSSTTAHHHHHQVIIIRRSNHAWGRRHRHWRLIRVATDSVQIVIHHWEWSIEFERAMSWVWERPEKREREWVFIIWFFWD